MKINKKHILVVFNWYSPCLHRGIVRFARENNWYLSYSTSISHYKGLSWGGDGLIFQSNGSEEYSSFVKSHNCAKACIGKGWDSFWDGPIFSDDNKKIGYLAADYYCDRGFRNFAWCAPDQSSTRLYYFEERLRAKGYSCEILAPKQGDLDWKARQSFFKKKLKMLPKPLAILGVEDSAAAEIMEVAINMGYSVPEQVAVMGVRNDEMICNTLMVPLTSIDNNLEEVGYQVASELAEVMKGKQSHKDSIKIAPLGVVSRQSTDIVAIDHAQVALVLQYLKNNFKYTINISKLAEVAKMSERGLFKAFEKNIGRTPGQELTRLRMNEAKRLLRESDETVTEIALLCGFNESRSFYTQFKKHTQQTPGSWRKKVSKRP